jgi:hypothetical protein
MHVHGVAPVHAWNAPSTHTSPVQQPELGVQDWPAPLQVLAWHVPLVAPGATLQVMPEQQSDTAEQAAPFGWQALTTWQMLPTHEPEQQLALPVQLEPLVLHAVPPSTGGTPQTLEGERHSVPEQQAPVPVAPGVQLPPGGKQDAAWQVEVPASPEAKQSIPLQHWSLNAQPWPWAMQQLP